MSPEKGIPKTTGPQLPAPFQGAHSGSQGERDGKLVLPARVINTALKKPVAMFELREINPDSTFYDTIMGEGVQIA